MSELPEIPGYEIFDKIGTGSTATVWRARQQSLNRIVAIKILRPELWTQLDEADAFLAEAHSVALLKSRHVVQVYDVGRLDHTAYIVMEYVEGSSLDEHLQQKGKMAPREAMQIVAAIADALRDAWESQKMIHRDIKPDNIIIEDDGSIKLADLGLARQIDGDHPHDTSEEIAGTPNYMSPEQATGNTALSPASDMYSLGATLYHMLCGYPPFEGMSVEEILSAQISKQLPWPQDISSKIPLSYCQFTARLMMKDPELRYSSWDKVYADAVKLAEGKMLMIKIPSEGSSTIGSPGQIKTPPKKIEKRKMAPATANAKSIPRYKAKMAPTTGNAQPASRYKRKPPVPIFLKRTLGWMRMIGFSYIIWLLLIQPFLAYKELSKAVAIQPIPEVIPDSPASSPESAPTMDSQDIDRSYPLTDTQDQADVVATESGETEVPIAKMADPMELQQQILALLAKQMQGQARQLLQENGRIIPDQETASALIRLLLLENQPEALMAQVLSLARVRPIQLTINGQKTPIIVESIDGDIVQAITKTVSGTTTITRPVSFNISQLPPAEQVGLLSLSRSPLAPYALSISALQSADLAKVLELAPQLDVLEPALRQYAESRIERLTQP